MVGCSHFACKAVPIGVNHPNIVVGKEKVLAAVATAIDGTRLNRFVCPLVDTHQISLNRLCSRHLHTPTGADLVHRWRRGW